MNKLKPASYKEFISAFSAEVPENFNFSFDVLDAIAAKDPQRCAIVHVGPDGYRREYDFGWLAATSCRLANALQAQGVGKGDRVMIILYRRIEFWVTMLALHRLGAVGVPSPNLLTTKDIVYRVATGNISVVIAEDSVAATVDAARAESPGLKVLVQAGPGMLLPGWVQYDALCATAADEFPRPTDAACGDDPLLIFFSSGTTGPPKMVMHNHCYPIGHYVTGAYWHDLMPGDLHLTVADTGWGKAVWGKMYGQWMAGASVFVYDFRGKFTPADLLGVLAREGVTSFCAPPTIYRFLIREDLAKYDLSRLRHCTTAGELLNTSVFEDWQRMTGLPIFEGYGQTETTLQIATFPFMESKPGSIGRPTPGWDVVLLNGQGQEVGSGEEGEICIRLGEEPVLGLFSEYLDEPQKTANAMEGGFYHTGDKAWRDEDGYYWFLGRVDDLIKSSGYRIGPFEVESALISHEAVVEAAVTGVPDEVRGQAVKATIVLAPGFEGTKELTKELQDHVKKITAPYKYPRVIAYVAELPKTISGKIKRAEIRAQDLEK
ncbi:MAG: AMP-binding protein [Proteobacteria bacterium]|nr:AMP-binding protein [Pseudomonadota bacterium]